TSECSSVRIRWLTASNSSFTAWWKGSIGGLGVVNVGRHPRVAVYGCQERWRAPPLAGTRRKTPEVTLAAWGSIGIECAPLYQGPGHGGTGRVEQPSIQSRTLYAVIVSGGKQHRVVEGEVLRLEKLEVATGESINFDQVLMVADGDSIK